MLEIRLTTVALTGNRPGTAGGFTMVELMVVLAVLGAVMVLAAPGYRALILNNRMLSETYALRATLSNARAEALARRAPVVVCPTANGTACDTSRTNWATGYMTFVDTNNDMLADATNADEEIIQYEAREGSTTTTFDNLANRVRFNPRGHALNSEGTFTFCDPRGAERARALMLAPVGSLRSAVDTDSPEDGIVNDASDTNVSC